MTVAPGRAGYPPRVPRRRAALVHAGSRHTRFAVITQQNASELHIVVIGAPSITTSLGPIRASKPVVFAAALYLGMQRGRAIRRSELAALLWPDENEATHRERTRWLLYQLKRAGLTFEARQPEFALAPGCASLDIEAIERSTSVDSVLDHSRGDVLAGYDPQISDTFSHWVCDARDAMRSRLEHVLDRWRVLARRDMDWRMTEAVARRQLGIDPYHEAASVALAEALALQGRRVEAVATLGRHAEARYAGSPVTPSLVLRERMRDHKEAAREATTPRAALDTLVGREVLLGRLLGGATRGPLTRRIGVAGPPGIGKTRLLQEVQALSALRGVQVLRLRSAREDALRLRSLVTDLAKSLLEARGALGASPDVLAYLRPLATAGFSDTRTLTAASAEPEGGMATLYAALAELLHAVAEDGPLTITIDDAHRAEVSSWPILAPLFPIVSTDAVTWVIALCADTMQSAGQQFLTIFPQDDVASDQSRDLLWLPPLAEVDVRTLCIARAAPRLIPPTALNGIVRDAMGTPFFAEALTDHWLGSGDVAGLSPSIARLVHSRLDYLDQTVERVLTAVAILGADATAPAVESLVMIGRSAFLAALRILEGAGIVQVAAGVLCAPQLWRELALSRAPTTTVQLLHHSAAEWLELHEPIDQPAWTERLGRVAAHWRDAGDDSRSRLALDLALLSEVDVQARERTFMDRGVEPVLAHERRSVRPQRRGMAPQAHVVQTLGGLA